MGAGKTYLMASFIYLDLYFAGLYKNDKRFAHNFVVFAPQASKTAILPSLQTIKDFNPEWILPKAEAQKIKQIIQIEILDALSSKRKDKLQGNNPNLEKVNRMTQTNDFGMVFITNAEKVVLERYDDKDKLVIDPKSLLYDEKKASEISKINELREKLSQTPFLGVILDEVHHTYGNIKESEEKKLRKAVNILDQHKNVVSVIGMSGTPYVKHTVSLGKDNIRLNQIQDIVYNFPLNEGIGKFLKIPEVRGVDIREKLFLKQALSEFFKNFNLTYSNGTKSKMAIYCPSIKSLNEEILPVISEWYRENRKSKEKEIFKFYREEKDYKLPKDSQAIFNNLDKPYSDKRIVLLVAIGKEGWDCRSLASVVLPRQKTTKNFVLQTTCRCLREVDNASNEQALIYLESKNYETLDKELKENYNLKISDLRIKSEETIPVTIRKPKLGKLKYKQVSTNYEIISVKSKDIEKEIKKFDFKTLKKQFSFSKNAIKGKIGRAGLTEEVYLKSNKENEVFEYDFSDFIYDLARITFGKLSESELIKNYDKELKVIFKKVSKEKEWIHANPYLEIEDMVKIIATLFTEEITYKTEEITENIEIELLEWDTKEPRMTLMTTSGSLFKFLPKFNKKEAVIYQRHPEDLENDYFDKENIDPQDVSFNYIPYRMDSDFERNALTEMLKMSELAGLEVYFNGYKDNNLNSFWIKTPRGVYTPDFLVIKRKENKKYKDKNIKGEIEKVLVIETKGKPYYDEEFRQKESFVMNEFIKHNPKFSYKNFVDLEGKNDFKKYLEEFSQIIKSF